MVLVIPLIRKCVCEGTRRTTLLMSGGFRIGGIGRGWPKPRASVMRLPSSWSSTQLWKITIMTVARLPVHKSYLWKQPKCASIKTYWDAKGDVLTQTGFHCHACSPAPPHLDSMWKVMMLNHVVCDYLVSDKTHLGCCWWACTLIRHCMVVEPTPVTTISCRQKLLSPQNIPNASPVTTIRCQAISYNINRHRSLRLANA